MTAFTGAHRGLSSEHPENTVQAFRAAAAAGFPAFELDVRMTRDEEVVVLHDEGLERTTGASGRVADMLYDEVRSYDTGGGPVPRLDDLLSTFDDWKGLWDIEVKSPRATLPALDVLDHHQIGKRALLTAMDPGVLRKARQHAPDTLRGLIVLGPPDDEDLEEARTTECAWILLDANFVGEVELAEAKETGMKVGMWTVNDPELAAELAGWGADCVLTDTRAVLSKLGTDGPQRWV